MEPNEDILYMTIHAYTSFSHLAVMCTFTIPGQPQPDPSPSPDPNNAYRLEAGAVTTISAELDETLRFTLPFSSRREQQVRCTTSGGKGDADLHMSWSGPIDFESPGGDTVSYPDTKSQCPCVRMCFSRLPPLCVCCLPSFRLKVCPTATRKRRSMSTDLTRRTRSSPCWTPGIPCL